MPRPGPLQEIPRPPTWRPGGPAPWAEASAARRAGITVGRVLEALSAAGQVGAAPEGLGLDDVAQARQMEVAGVDVPRRANAGVLATLFDEEGEARVILTRRSSSLRTHTNEVSFPGGRLDHGEDPPAAALREAHEEIGLDPSLVTLVGWLHPVLVWRSSSLIMPLVASLSARPGLVANPTEVDRVFDVSLADLAAPEIFHEEHWRVAGGRKFPVWFFEVSGEMIWGATARMIHELLRVVLTAPGAG